MSTTTKEFIQMTIKRIRASVTHAGNFGPRVQSRETSKASTRAELGVVKPKTPGAEKIPGVLSGKALAEQILAEENRRG